MTTSLSTEFMSGGFSIQRNEMVSMQQQKHRQKFQFLNSFNQTFTRLIAALLKENLIEFLHIQSVFTEKAVYWWNRYHSNLQTH